MKEAVLLVFMALMEMTNQAFPCNEGQVNPWKVEGAFGILRYADTGANGNQSAVGRLSIGRTLLSRSFGEAFLDIGIQSGNTLRLDAPKQDIDALGGIPIETQMKPLLDVLFGIKTEPLWGLPLSTWLKGGIAYRELQLDRLSVPDVAGFAPEIQAGLGYRINEQASLNLGYQYIHGKKPELTVNPLTETGILANIPAQHTILIGFAVSFL